jgi:bifunctional ADP-heptose synthase (sugar kinase/adenylyltransferase)
MKILVVGDSCTDVFVYGDVTRLTPEAPVPVFNPIRKVSNAGMSKNVANNLEALGETVYNITNPNTIKKIRYVDKKSNQLVLRVDEHDYCDRINTDVLSSIKDNKCTIPMSGQVKIDSIIISDYCKGFLEEDDIQYICENNSNVFVDTKKKIDNWIYSIDYLKINSLEYQENKYFIDNNEWLLKKTIITKGNAGCLFQGKTYPTDDVLVKDISGAGDTFLAGLVVEYIKTDDIVKSIGFAQDCTTKVVQKHGVSTI